MSLLPTVHACQLHAYLIFLWVAVFVLFPSNKMLSQCEITVSSSNGYEVDIYLDPVTIQAPSSCPNGYQFKVRLEYVIDFNGNNIPPNLWTLQGNIDCGNIENIFFNLPNDGGSGFILSSNAWNPASNCATATPESLDCGTLDLTIEGPGIPYQTISCNVVLPIRLLGFEGYKKDESVILRWSTVKEMKNDYFTVQCSKNGQLWDVVDRVPSKADSMGVVEYKTIDPDPYSGTSYYRLKQTDIDGSSTYSDIITVQFDESDDRVEVYPNPAINRINIIHGGHIHGILDILGCDRSNAVHIERSEHSNIEIDISALPQGIYLIRTDQSVEKVYKLSP